MDKKKPGPKPENIAAQDIDWKDAMEHALNTSKPKDDQAEPTSD